MEILSLSPLKKILLKISSSHKDFFNQRKVWCAASTHDDEEEFLFKNTFRN